MFLPFTIFAYVLPTVQSSELDSNRVIEFCQAVSQGGSQSRCYEHFLRMDAAGTDPSDAGLCECSVSKAFSCGTNVYKCSACYTNGITSPECQKCLKGVGSTCCPCVAHAVGSRNKKLGNGICSQCSNFLSLSATTQGNEEVANTRDSTALKVRNACASANTQADKATCLVNLARNFAYAALAQGFQPPPQQQTAVVTQKGETVQVEPHALLGCSFFDFKCHFNKGKCGLCKKAIPALVKTGSQVACDAACVLIVEALGGGPEDIIADIVALSCLPLCNYAFSAAAKAGAGAVCRKAKLC